ncbi:unnamed protein product [Lathyrus sativus]|nr:unnamed protein product [Lathyrus sativus]
MKNEVDINGGSVDPSRNEEAKKGWRKVLEQIESWMVHEDMEDKWLEQMRGNLGLIATIITTMTFQTGLNPPGGIRPVKDDGVTRCIFIQNVQQCPGETVLGVLHPSDYILYIYSNTICFISSLCVLFLLVSGIRLNHRFPIGILSVGMCLTLTSLVVTYITALRMLTPDVVWGEEKKLIKLLYIISAGMLLFLALFLTLRITIWGVNVFSKKKKNSQVLE